MSTNDLNSAMSIFQYEIENNDYDVIDLYENKFFKQKIESYIIATIMDGKKQHECLDWIVNVLNEKKFEENIISKVRSNAELQYCILASFIETTRIKK